MNGSGAETGGRHHRSHYGHCAPGPAPERLADQLHIESGESRSRDDDDRLHHHKVQPPGQDGEPQQQSAERSAPDRALALFGANSPHEKQKDQWQPDGGLDHIEPFAARHKTAH